MQRGGQSPFTWPEITGHNSSYASFLITPNFQVISAPAHNGFYTADLVRRKLQSARSTRSLVEPGTRPGGPPPVSQNDGSPDHSEKESFAMADPRSTTLTTAELQHLADRLYSRGVSRMLDDSPSMQVDLRIASRALRVLLSEIDRVASVANDLERTLRNLRITIDAEG
jgi:hypothetical protein